MESRLLPPLSDLPSADFWKQTSESQIKELCDLVALWESDCPEIGSLWVQIQSVNIGCK